MTYIAESEREFADFVGDVSDVSRYSIYTRLKPQSKQRCNRCKRCNPYGGRCAAYTRRTPVGAIPLGVVARFGAQRGDAQ